MKTVNNINLSNKRRYKRLCQGEPIEACMLVAIMGQMNVNLYNNNNIFLNFDMKTIL